MDKLLSLLNTATGELVGILLICIVGMFALFYLAKTGTETKSALNTLQIVKVVLRSKLGSKADQILDIWIKGLELIQDGEFSSEDAVDQFVRYIRLGAAEKGIELTEEDVDKINMLVLSTLENFTGKKPQQIKAVVNKFNAMNAK